MMMANTVVTASKWRLLLALVLGAIACWLTPSNVSAHAAYESSTPGFAEVLNESPTEITIRFTQELFRREDANEMHLVLTQSPGLGVDYELGSVEISNDDRRVMSVDVLVELPPGRYSVAWRNLSAEDGDEDVGRFPFYVRSDPEPWQIEADRLMAESLLIAYPGDAEDEPEAEVTSAPAAPAVVRSESSDSAGLGVGPIVWLIVGIVAGLVLVGSLGFHLRRRRPGR